MFVAVFYNSKEFYVSADSWNSNTRNKLTLYSEPEDSAVALSDGYTLRVNRNELTPKYPKV